VGTSATAGYENRDIAVESRETLVECSEATLIDPREVCQVGVRYLPVANDPVQAHVVVADVVWPEYVAGKASHAPEHLQRSGAAAALSQK
jgi:hypothetical protein